MNLLRAENRQFQINIKQRRIYNQQVVFFLMFHRHQMTVPHPPGEYRPYVFFSGILAIRLHIMQRVLFLNYFFCYHFSVGRYPDKIHSSCQIFNINSRLIFNAISRHYHLSFCI